MSTAATSFYVTGGTLRHDAPSYVPRQADQDLYDALSRGEFCYILTSRQMGKSSLMARTAARLREEGVAVALLDLTAVGQNLSPEQWYDGLRELLGMQLGVEEELDDFWLDQSRLGPLQRWMKALREVVLARIPGRVVIFIDEIDTVQSLPFSTDEFFAAIRECYNRRSQDRDFERLTFCLLGVASPSDLIRDTRLTPFNIGRRIELTDFIEAEAAPLADGLGGILATVDTESTEEEARRVLRRVLYWTDGHPYLTQRLCRAIAEAQTAAISSELSPSSSVFSPGHGPRGHRAQRGRRSLPLAPKRGSPSSAAKLPSQLVDHLCADLFLSKSAQETDDNLLFVRERLLKSEADAAGLLDLYGQVRRGKRILPDDTNPLVSLLALSGIVRKAALGSRLSALGGDGDRPLGRWSTLIRVVADSRELRAESCLSVRNRIYARVFDRAWVTTHMPDAELRRQRAAYRRGLARATTVALVVVATTAGLALTALNQAHRARRERRAAFQQRQLADQQRHLAEERLYAANMAGARRSWEVGGIRQAVEFLDAWRPEPGQEDLRGFEWRYLWRLCQRGDELATLQVRSGEVSSVTFSPDGKTLAVSGQDDAVKLWDVASRTRIAVLPRTYGPLAFSPDGKTLATVWSSGVNWTIRLWNLATRKETVALSGHTGFVGSVAFSPDGRLLASGSEDRTVRLWDLRRSRSLGSLKHALGVGPVTFSPDGRTLAAGSFNVITLWNVAEKRAFASLTEDAGRIFALAFSPDGHTLAAGHFDTTVVLWNVATRSRSAVLRGHKARVFSLAFSPDGQTLATGGEDHTVRLWDVRERREVLSLRGHTDAVNVVAFSPVGGTARRPGLLASGGADHTVKLWAPAAKPEPELLRGHQAGISWVTFAPDGKTLATGSWDNSVRLWDLAGRRSLATLRGPVIGQRQVAFSPDGKRLAIGTGVFDVPDRPGDLTLWDVATRRQISTLGRFADGVIAVAFAPDGKTVAIGGNAGAVRLLDLNTRRSTALTGHKGLVHSLAFSPDGRTLATASFDQTVKLWDVASGREEGSLNRHRGPVDGVAFSPDGKTLASASWDHTVKLWDLASQREMATLKGLTVVFSVAFSPDGKTLAAGTLGSGVKLWSVSTRQEMATLPGPSGYAPVAFSPDGQLLASGSGSDGRTVHLWRAATFPETDPLWVAARAGDRSVELQWRPLRYATGYALYRGPAGAAGSRLKKLQTRPAAEASFTDHSKELTNGVPLTYAIAALSRDANGKPKEGPRLAVWATPAAAPPGFFGCSIGETTRTGSASFDRASGEILLRGGGEDMWGTTDHGYFLGQAVAGDFQITVKMLTRPTGTHDYAKAGLMVRESLEGGARDAALFVHYTRLGLLFQWRADLNDAMGASDSSGSYPLIPDAAVRLPILLRMIRRGDRINAEYSRDEGKTFQMAGDLWPPDPPLARTIYAGLAITAHDPNRISEARFRDLEVRQIRPAHEGRRSR